MVLSYSGLGFGGSGCKITLDDRDYDGKAGSQLVTFLGKLDYVKKDATGHDGIHHADDPRVGMIGGSYGGQIQFAVAGIDPRVDTIIPIITWNDLSYSLAPNNTSFDHGVTYQTPGVEKAEWTTLFFGLGIADGLMGATGDPTRVVGPCPNFDDRACGSKAQMDATGAPNDATLLFARHASVESFVNDIKIPTLLAQGQGDTLFNLQEAVATYRSLKAQGTPVKMIWQSWGHSTSDPAPGEFTYKDPEASYETRTFLQWFDHYLAGAAPAPALDFTYFRDWVSYKGDATAAYAESNAYPVGNAKQLFLSGSNALVDSAASAVAGSASFATPAAGAPTSYSETSAVDQSGPVSDAPGTFAQFSTPPLSADTDVVGVPTADVTVSAPTFANAASTTGAPGELTLFFKLYDIKPDGTVVLAHRLIAPVRIADFTHPVHVELPGIVHRFAKGDRIALTIAAGDAAYRGTNIVGPVSVTTGAGNVLSLPVVAAADQKPVSATPLADAVPTNAVAAGLRRQAQVLVPGAPAEGGPRGPRRRVRERQAGQADQRATGQAGHAGAAAEGRLQREDRRHDQPEVADDQRAALPRLQEEPPAHARRAPALERVRVRADRLRRRQHLTRRRRIGRILRQVRVADRAVRGYDQHAAQLRRAADDAALVDDDVALLHARHHGVLRAGRDDLRREQLTERRDLRAGRLIGAAVGVDEQLDLDPLRALERRRLLDSAVADRRQLDARGLEVVPRPVQLDRMLAAEDAAPVAQERERGRAVRPEVAEPHVVTLVVLQHDLLERVRVGRRARALAGGDVVPHQPQSSAVRPSTLRFHNFCNLAVSSRVLRGTREMWQRAVGRGRWASFTQHTTVARIGSSLPSEPHPSRVPGSSSQRR